MDAIDIIREGLARVTEQVPGVLDGLDAGELSRRPGPDANPIGWLVWHLTRVQDNHVAELAEALGITTAGELWQREWRERFELPYAADASGYGQTSDEVGAFRATAEQLLGYHQAVQQATEQVLGQLTVAQLDEVVDTRWDPPVTAGVRLVSVVNDLTQHIGQASYAKGLLAAG